MRWMYIALTSVLVGAIALIYVTGVFGPDSREDAASVSDAADRIRLTTPQPNDEITSPLVIEGQARGSWYFEADFPIILTDWDGRIIAEHYAVAGDEWMTEDFVPFSAEVEFDTPYTPGDPDFMRYGSLILQRANPSGLPENDAALEIRVRFAEQEPAGAAP